MNGMGRITTRSIGFPLEDDAELFERLMFEINQAGLSWLTILRKREAFRQAYGGFVPEVVAAYRSTLTAARLLADRRDHPKPAEGRCGDLQCQTISISERPRVIRRLAGRPSPRSKEEWVKLFKQTFRFTGGEIVDEFLMSIGYLPGAHVPTCPVYSRILDRRPAWSDKKA